MRGRCRRGGVGPSGGTAPSGAQATCETLAVLSGLGVERAILVESTKKPVGEQVLPRVVEPFHGSREQEHGVDALGGRI